mmetsp:Transcript_19919/g.49711  ORF Transcript_19919/g.49711 Transcript_19919/m.49711 type:complete len:329 (+) Transcript_19919:2292-3278(+)
MIRLKHRSRFDLGLSLALHDFKAICQSDLFDANELLQEDRLELRLRDRTIFVCINVLKDLHPACRSKSKLLTTQSLRERLQVRNKFIFWNMAHAIADAAVKALMRQLLVLHMVTQRCSQGPNTRRDQEFCTTFLEQWSRYLLGLLHFLIHACQSVVRLFQKSLCGVLFLVLTGHSLVLSQLVFRLPQASLQLLEGIFMCGIGKHVPLLVSQELVCLRNCILGLLETVDKFLTLLFRHVGLAILKGLSSLGHLLHRSLSGAHLLARFLHKSSLLASLSVLLKLPELRCSCIDTLRKLCKLLRCRLGCCGSKVLDLEVLRSDEGTSCADR